MGAETDEQCVTTGSLNRRHKTTLKNAVVVVAYLILLTDFSSVLCC